MEESIASNNSESGELQAPPDGQSEELASGVQTSLPSVVSVFDGSENIPKDLPVSNVLDLMTAESSAIVPNYLENRIEESAQQKDKFPSGLHDDINPDELNDFAAALLKTKIDFSQEDEISSEISEPISPMAKELLGDDFDFDALEKQAKQSSAALASVNGNNAEMTLDIQEDAFGIVHVSSPFPFVDSLTFADFGVPQTVLSSFSDDWIQESGNTAESEGGDAVNFCFTEELQPMFVRKKKAN